MLSFSRMCKAVPSVAVQKCTPGLQINEKKTLILVVGMQLLCTHQRKEHQINYVTKSENTLHVFWVHMVPFLQSSEQLRQKWVTYCHQIPVWSRCFMCTVFITLCHHQKSSAQQKMSRNNNDMDASCSFFRKKDLLLIYVFNCQGVPHHPLLVGGCHFPPGWWPLL